jgi:hypothetical protein
LVAMELSLRAPSLTTLKSAIAVLFDMDQNVTR